MVYALSVYLCIQEWLSNLLATPYVTVIQRVDRSRMAAGDILVGDARLGLVDVAHLIEGGVRVFSLELDRPSLARGAILTVGQMEECGARLVEYDIQKKGEL